MPLQFFNILFPHLYLLSELNRRVGLNRAPINFLQLQYQVEHREGGARKERDHKQRKMKRNGKAARSYSIPTYLQGKSTQILMGTRISLGSDPR
jgi:hypothetical protein